MQNIKNFCKRSKYKKYKTGLSLCGLCVVHCAGVYCVTGRA